MAGNPNPKGSKPDKLMRDAIIVALNREAEDAQGQPTRKLALVAEQLVELALAGDMQAIKEVNDRVDGKSPQEHTGEIKHRYIARMPALIKDGTDWQQQHAEALKNPTLQ